MAFKLKKHMHALGCAYADSAAGMQYSVSTVHRALVPRAETTWLYEGQPKAMHATPATRLHCSSCSCPDAACLLHSPG